MKKVTILLALLLSSVALVACGGGDDDTTNATTDATTNGAESTNGGATGGAGAEKEGGGGGEGGGASTLAFEADPGGQLAYTTDSASTKAGSVTIDFTNPQSLPHDVVIESGGEDVGGTETIAEGSSSAVVNLKPGSYQFYCSVPGHREAGMEGTLTVK